jgi:thiol-disulfide isomerase/thioredoxin
VRPETRKVLVLCPAVLLVAVLAGCSSGTSVEASVKPEAKRKSATDFALKDLNGNTARLSDYRGKVVLLNFWATWCGPCKIEIPWFIEFEQKYKDRGFAVLGIAMDDEGWDAVKPYLAARKVNYRVVIGNDDLAQRYGGVDSLPTTFVIDRDGRIASQHVGLVSRKDYEGEINQLLEGSQRAAR